jgi:hypothetical protein
MGLLGLFVPKKRREVCGHFSPYDRHAPAPEAASIRISGVLGRGYYTASFVP